MKNLAKIIGLIMFLFSSYSSFAQEHIAGIVTIYGKVESNDQLLDDYTITVVKNNKFQQIIDIDHKKGYRLDLSLDGVYSIAYEKSGFLTKSVIVNGLIDSTLDVNRTTFQMDIDLVSVEDFMQDKFCLLPVAKIYFDPKNEVFTFDKSYTKEMLKLYDRIKSRSKDSD
tara:strand:- start:785 stop:1291 length:507 start_codon:yes stop_codon:yes gene_type:complete